MTADSATVQPKGTLYPLILTLCPYELSPGRTRRYGAIREQRFASLLPKGHVVESFHQQLPCGARNSQ